MERVGQTGLQHSACLPQATQPEARLAAMWLRIRGTGLQGTGVRRGLDTESESVAGVIKPPSSHIPPGSRQHPPSPVGEAE